jgi:CheY-like chemotaxis protein
MRSDCWRGVAHDFNNLLLVISSYAELMQDSIGPEHRLHRNVQEILSASRRAADLTLQLLAFGRKQTQTLQILNLNTVLRDISRMLPRLIGEDVELTIAPEADLGKVKLDPVQLEQIVMNLAANARDAMPAGGKLTIATHNVELDDAYVQTRTVLPPGQYVLLEVSDSGKASTPNICHTSLSPFTPLRKKAREPVSGWRPCMGSSSKAADLSGSIANWGWGRRSGFISLGSSIVPGRQARATACMQPSTETVLLVEDENAVRHPACEFLKRCGYNVIEAKDGLEAVEAAARHKGRIDLMVTDVVMPGMSGGQLAEKVVLRHNILDMRTNFLQKPFTLKSLGGKVREVLGKASVAAGVAGD